MIKRILAYSRRPYPQLGLPWWKEILFTCGLVFLLFVIFEPFGVGSQSGVYKWMLIGGFTVISALCVEMPRWVLPLFLGKGFFEERNWTVGKNIFYNVFILLSIGIGIYLYLSIFFIASGFHLTTFFVVVWDTFLIGIFPVGLMTVMIENRNMSRHTREVAALNEHLRESKLSVVEAVSLPVGRIVLPDGLKETLELEPDGLVLAESDGNYVKIVYCDGEKVFQRSLRITMKQVEDAFSVYPFIQKCHRAFLVNLHFIEKVKGNSQGYRLVLKGWSEEIPVARTYNKEIRDKVCHSSQK